MGRGHTRSSDYRLSGRDLARHQGQPADGRRQNHGAIPQGELRAFGNRSHGRRSQSVHEAMDCQGEPDARARYRLDRFYLCGKRKGYKAHGGEMKTKAMVIAAVLAVPLAAQWSYPTAGVPQTKDGKPNLSA